MLIWIITKIESLCTRFKVINS